MFKEIVVHACFGERTGYQIHASRFFPKLEKLVSEAKGTGTVHISLLDVVTASNTTVRQPFPSILFSVWESTEYPQEFINKLTLYDQLWVPSEWQRAASIAQGIPEEFVKVVPEGVDPDIYKPFSGPGHSGTSSCSGLNANNCEKCEQKQRKECRPNWPKINGRCFTFVHVGQWQPRKSTIEIIQAFQKAFPINKEEYENVRLELSVDTLFPSDEYKSTEERLEAYGINDPRISVIHFEERNSYIRRLQSAHCFVSCARSEGWGLPIIEAIACGVPTIVSDWGGSTEYHDGCIKVPIKQLIKPFGIYGNWDVPGKWCDPDFEALALAMRFPYDHYAEEKEKALKLSDKIRDKFSWDAAAKKAFDVLEQLHKDCQSAPEFVTKDLTNTAQHLKEPVFSEEDIKLYAKKHGFEILSMRKVPSIFVIGTWPNSQEKIETLIETIKQVKDFGHPVLIATHYQLPAPILEMVDYVVYEKKNVLSGEWCAEYCRRLGDGTTQVTRSRIPYHGVACLNNIRNAVDFCRGKFSRMFYLEYDCEVDLDKFMEAVHSSEKPFTGIDYEGCGLRTDIWSGDIDFLDKNIPYIHSWDEYTAGMKEINSEYPLEKWLFNKISTDGLNLISLETGNRYDQVDRELWPDDLFSVNFNDGPYLHINGISNRNYEVKFNVGEENVFTVMQKAGMWSRPTPKFFRPWTVIATLNGEEKFRHDINLKGKRVMISMGSKALGDSIAWIPYVEEFRKKHDCHVICSGWWQEIFDYPDIEFIKPGSEVKDLYAVYTVGCFDDQLDKNPINWREVPLQKVASDILGLEYKPIRAKLKEVPNIGVSKNTVCFSEFSTMQNKMWNREGAWQKVVDYLVSENLLPVSVSVEKSQLQNIVDHNGQSIQQTISDIKNCEFYIGLNHGPAWLAYALGKPTIMITGVSEEWNDFPTPYRIAINEKVCGIGCFNDTTLPIDRGWSWCPRNKKFVCTSQITEKMVIKTIEKLRGDINAAEKGIVTKSDKPKHKGNGGRRINESRKRVPLREEISSSTVS